MSHSEFRTRLLSGLVLALAVLFFAWYDQVSFDAMCLLGAAILLLEWLRLTRMRSFWFVPLGIIYIAAATGSLIYLRQENLNILLALLLIVWTGDSAAYVVGKQFGRHKLVPRISPGKSWEGLVAAIICSAAVAAALGHVAPIPHAILGAALAVIGLGGDLLESALKRRAGVKDSGRLIPGHGGLFDRVDALIPCAIFAGAALYIRLHLQ